MLRFIWALCPNACACRKKGKETRQGLPSALVQGDDRWLHLKLTLLARVNFPPHKPYIVAPFTHNMNYQFDEGQKGPKLSWDYTSEMRKCNTGIIFILHSKLQQFFTAPTDK